MAVVKVRSSLDRAVQLRLYEMSDGEHASWGQNPTGVPTARRLPGDPVIIRPGTLTEVDASFWDKWCADNEDGDLLKGEHLVAEERVD